MVCYSYKRMSYNFFFRLQVQEKVIFEKIENSFFFRLEFLMIMSANLSLIEPSGIYFSQTRVFPISLRFRTLNLPSTSILPW